MATNNAINTPQITLGGTFTMSGAHNFTGTITADTNVTFPTSGLLATTTGGGIPLTVDTSGTVSMAVNHAYASNASGLDTMTLPAVSAVGDIVQVMAYGANGWQIAQGSGQSILFGTSTTTSGATGYLASTAAQGDAVSMRCIVANTVWQVTDAVGNITVH